MTKEAASTASEAEPERRDTDRVVEELTPDQKKGLQKYMQGDELSYTLLLISSLNRACARSGVRNEECNMPCHAYV